MMADEELIDEVKVFRGDEDADDDPMISGETSEQQLADDKKEAVMEAELDGPGRISSIGNLKATIKAENSPSFPMVPGLFPTAPFSPSYPVPMFMPLFMSSPYGLRSPSFMSLPMAPGLSPSFQMFPASPLYGVAAAAAAAQRQLENIPFHMRAGPLNPLNQIRMPPNMPLNVATQNNEKRAYGGGKVKKEPHVKKPLNAFMWYMKENRKALLEELGNSDKQSAELNKELGRRWGALPKDEQQKYFEMAKVDRERHKELHPQWSARENYAVNKKKTKKRRDKSVASENNDQKKCRARFGVNNTEMWCKFCKRKKKCEYATDRSGSDVTDNQDGRGTSGACSSSSASPSPTGNTGLPLAHQHQAAIMHSMLMQMHLGSTSTHVPSPIASSSAGRSPVDTNASDSESDVDEDEDIDPTIMQQTHEVIMQESACTL